MATLKKDKVIHISLWVAQVLLGSMFIMFGAMKALQPIDHLSPMMPWVNDAPSALVRFIGISEVLGGIGLLLPALLRIKPILTPFAALGLALIQVLAAIFHISRGETSLIGMNFVLLSIALFIVWGRMKKAPIEPK